MSSSRLPRRFSDATLSEDSTKARATSRDHRRMTFDPNHYGRAQRFSHMTRTPESSIVGTSRDSIVNRSGGVSDVSKSRTPSRNNKAAAMPAAGRTASLPRMDTSRPGTPLGAAAGLTMSAGLRDSSRRSSPGSQSQRSSSGHTSSRTTLGGAAFLTAIASEKSIVRRFHDRLKADLQAGLRALQRELPSDDVLAQLLRDPASAHFAVHRIGEVVEACLVSAESRQLHASLTELAARDEVVSTLTDEVARMERLLDAPVHELESTRKENRQLHRKVSELETEQRRLERMLDAERGESASRRHTGFDDFLAEYIGHRIETVGRTSGGRHEDLKPSGTSTTRHAAAADSAAAQEWKQRFEQQGLSLDAATAALESRTAELEKASQELAMLRRDAAELLNRTNLAEWRSSNEAARVAGQSAAELEALKGEHQHEMHLLRAELSDWQRLAAHLSDAHIHAIAFLEAMMEVSARGDGERLSSTLRAQFDRVVAMFSTDGLLPVVTSESAKNWIATKASVIRLKVDDAVSAVSKCVDDVALQQAAAQVTVRGDLVPAVQSEEIHAWVTSAVDNVVRRAMDTLLGDRESFFAREIASATGVVVSGVANSAPAVELRESMTSLHTALRSTEVLLRAWQSDSGVVNVDDRMASARAHELTSAAHEVIGDSSPLASSPAAEGQDFCNAVKRALSEALREDDCWRSSPMHLHESRLRPLEDRAVIVDVCDKVQQLFDQVSHHGQQTTTLTQCMSESAAKLFAHFGGDDDMAAHRPDDRDVAAILRSATKSAIARGVSSEQERHLLRERNRALTADVTHVLQPQLDAVQIAHRRLVAEIGGQLDAAQRSTAWIVRNAVHLTAAAATTAISRLLDVVRELAFGDIDMRFSRRDVAFDTQPFVSPLRITVSEKEENSGGVDDQWELEERFDELKLACAAPGALFELPSASRDHAAATSDARDHETISSATLISQILQVARGARRCKIQKAALATQDACDDAFTTTAAALHFRVTTPAAAEAIQTEAPRVCTEEQLHKLVDEAAARAADVACEAYRVASAHHRQVADMATQVIPARTELRATAAQTDLDGSASVWRVANLTFADVGTYCDMEPIALAVLRDDADASRNLLEAKREQHETEIALLRAQLDEARLDTAAATDKVAKLQLKIADHKARQAELVRERDETVGSANELGHRLQLLQQELELSRKRWTVLESSHLAELEVLRGRNDDLISRVAREETRNAALHAKLSNLRIPGAAHEVSASRVYSSGVDLNRSDPFVSFGGGGGGDDGPGPQHPATSPTHYFHRPLDTSFGAVSHAKENALAAAGIRSGGTSGGAGDLRLGIATAMLERVVARPRATDSCVSPTNPRSPAGSTTARTPPPSGLAGVSPARPTFAEATQGPTAAAAGGATPHRVPANAARSDRSTGASVVRI